MNLVNVIDEAAIGEQAKINVFTSMREEAENKSRDQFETDCDVAEDLWMEKYFSADVDAKKWEVEKGGKQRWVNGAKGLSTAHDRGWVATGGYKWKYRSYLPKPYTSAKSVISNAFKHGIDFKGKGKTEINKEVTSARTKPDPEVVVAALADKFIVAYRKLPESDNKRAIRGIVTSAM